MTLTYLMAVWMLRRKRAMPLYASWRDKCSEIYAHEAHPTQIIAAKAVEMMAEEAYWQL